MSKMKYTVMRPNGGHTNHIVGDDGYALCNFHPSGRRGRWRRWPKGDELEPTCAACIKKRDRAEVLRRFKKLPLEKKK